MMWFQFNVNTSFARLKLFYFSENQFDSLWLSRDDDKTKGFPDQAIIHLRRDRGDGSGLSSGLDSTASRTTSFSESDCTYKVHKKRIRLKYKLNEKLTSLRNRNLSHPIKADLKDFISPREDTDLLKSPEGTFHVHKIFGDGNCMYRSVSYIIWGDENEHRSLRTMRPISVPEEERKQRFTSYFSATLMDACDKVVEHITDNWRDYSAFVMAEWNISNKQEYHDYMMTNGTYATELECVVATKLYHMNLSIYREIDDRGNLERIFHNRVNKNYRTARLLFSGRTESGHFDVLIPN